MKKRTNWFSRGLIVILIIFIVMLVIWAFIFGEPKYSLTNEMILLILLLIVLALSEVFDNFSIGNLLTVRKEKHEKEVELKEVKNENKELRAQLIGIVSNSISNKNTNIFGLSRDDLVQIAEFDQSENSNIEKIKEEDFNLDKKDSTITYGTQQKLFRNIEKLVLDRFCIEHKIPVLSIVRKVKFSNVFIETDPIMDRNAIFDAYYKSLNEELFIEISSFRSPLNLYNLYYLLSKVYSYRRENQLHAKVALIIPILPESYWKSKRAFDVNKNISNLQKTFAPAIKNDLLEIVSIEITQNDLDIINEKLNKEERQ